LAEGLKVAGFRLVSGGTDNHLVLVDLRPKKLTGKVAEEALGKVGITVNKNMIPWDPEKPMTTSGIRVGTPALTTRGMGATEMTLVARLIGRALDAPADEQVLAQVRGEVRDLCARFPMYQDRV
jgi:glycine hydroxymethyltransferase